VMTQGMQQIIRPCFVQLYIQKYGTCPHEILEAIIIAILAGELRVVKDDPQLWPLDHSIPILRQAWLDVVSPPLKPVAGE